MTPTLQLAALALATLQAPQKPAPAAAKPDDGWSSLDAVVMVVNENIITELALFRMIARENKEHPFKSEQEAREKELSLRTDLVKGMISVQAGQDMGLDPAIVDRSAKDVLDREMERFESTQGKAEYLESHGETTLNERKKQWEDALYAHTWEQSITGQGASSDQVRANRDRYIRPGTVRFTYMNCVQHPELLEQIGGQPQRVVVQQLVLDPQAAGGLEPARALALQLRQRILDGEDMADLVEKYSALKQKHGLTEPLAEARLALIDPAVGSFLAQAKPGDLSDVLSYKPSGSSKVGLRLLRLVERLPSVEPDITSSAVQQRIAERVRKDLDESRLSAAYEVIYSASYVWPPEFAKRPSTPAR